MEFVEDNLGNYFNMSELELQLLYNICNNDNDLEGLSQYIIEEIINQFNEYIEIIQLNVMPVNTKKIKKFKDLCDEDIVGKHFPITNVVKKFSFGLQMLYEIADQFKTTTNFSKYIFPIFIIVGLLGNCLSAIVLFRKKMRSISSNIYLGVLAINDIAYSIILFLNWLSIIEIIYINANFPYWLYFLINFLACISDFLSVWLIVVFTIERYIVTKYPLLRRSWCTVKRAKIVVITLMGLAILYSILQTLIIPGTRQKLIKKKEENVYDVYKQLQSDFQKGVLQAKSITDSIIIFALPTLVIVICNILIGYHIYQQRVRKALITTSDSSNARTQISNDKMLQHKITKKLILVSSIFVILKSPHYLYLYYYNYIFKYINASIVDVIILLNVAHYSINFILYCATGQIFRKELIRIFTSQYKKKQKFQGNR